jgi:DNA-binding response OmpR family regulator
MKNDGANPGIQRGWIAMKKVLIVDDEAHIRSLLEQTLEDLEDEDVEILTAGDGEEGLRKIRRETPELVFLDIMLPKMNGYDVCRAVKENELTRDSTIVLLTAKGQKSELYKGLELGAVDYITKPFDPDEVYEMARKLLGLDG